MTSFVENVNKVAALIPAEVVDLGVVVDNIDNINLLTPVITDLQSVVDNVVPNISEILLADDNAQTATTQAVIATTQAGIATTKANEAEQFRNEAEQFNLSKSFVVETLEELNTIPSSYTTAIIKDLNRGGTFIWSATGTANGGTVFAGATGYWNRQYSGSVNVKWFGAKGDGVTDDTIAIQAASNYCSSILDDKTNISTINIPTLWFDNSYGYRSTGTITVDQNINVIMDSALIVDFPSSQPIVGIIIGGNDSTRVSSRGNNHKIDVRRKNVSDWMSSTDVGVQFKSLFSSKAWIKRVDGFYYGVELTGTYNNVSLGEFRDNKIGLSLFHSSTQFTNQNTFIAGEFAVAGGVNRLLPRFGIALEDRGFGTSMNSHKFIGQSYELQNISGTYAVTLADSSSCEFLKQRTEGSGNTFAHIKSGTISKNNKFELIINSEYDYPYKNLILDESLTKVNNVAFCNNGNPFTSPSIIFDSGNISERAVQYNSAHNYIMNLEKINNYGGEGNPAQFTKYSDQAMLPNSNGDVVFGSHILGVRVMLEDCRNITISINSSDGGVNLNALPFDENGVQIMSQGMIFQNTSNGVFSYNSTVYGGLYTDNSCLKSNRAFMNLGFDASVKSVFIGFSFGTLNSFKIYGIGESKWFTHYSKEGTNRLIALNAPTLGTYKKGQIVYNDNPAGAGYIGWVCTVGGTPGTWKTFGAITA